MTHTSPCAPAERASFAMLNTIVLVLLIAVGCGTPTLDTSDIDSLQESLAALREPLEPEARAIFDESLGYLVGGSKPEDSVADPRLAPLILDIYKPLSGSSVTAVINQAYIKRAGQVKSEITKLEDTKVLSDETRDILLSFDLLDRRVYKINKGFLEWPMLQLRVENNTGHEIHLVRLKAVLLSPDDPEPWLMEEIDYLIYDGMEAGQRGMWRIEPKQQEWIQLVGPHPGLIFSVEVIGLTSVGNNILAETKWGAAEVHRLKIYKETLQVIRSTKTLALELAPRPIRDTK